MSRQLSKGVDQTPMTSWLASAATQMTTQWSQDQKDMDTHRLTLGSLESASQKKSYATNHGLSMVFEKNAQKTQEILGQLKTFPFLKELFETAMIGVHRNAADLYFSQFSEKKPTLVLSLKRPLDPLIQTLKVMGIDLSLIEKAGKERLVIFSSLPPTAAEELLAKVDFNSASLSLDSDMNAAMYSSFLITVSQQKHLALMFNLAQTELLEQRAVFTLTLPSYETLSSTELMIYIWSFFCISLALIWIVYFKTKEGQ